MKRDIFFSTINIIGLAIGIFLMLISILWLRYEFNFDKFHKNANRIFRVVAQFGTTGNPDNFAYTPGPLGAAMQNNIPEIIGYVRFGGSHGTQVRYGNTLFYEDITYSDPSIFKVFSFELLRGNPENALQDPHSIIVSEYNAKKYFGNDNPLGRILLLGIEKTPFVITGVMKDIPSNSQLQFNLLASFPKNPDDWTKWNYSTYILTLDENSEKSINNKLDDFSRKFVQKPDTKLHIQKLLRIHLYSNLRDDLSTNRSLRTIIIFCSICLVVTFIASVNYMNLAIARFAKRRKQVILRKILGAKRLEIFVEFFFESLMLTLIAICIALIAAYFFIPVFNTFVNISISNRALFDAIMLPIYLLLILFVSAITGIYPALIISSLKPAIVYNENIILIRSNSLKGFRSIIMIFQFVVAIIFIGCTIIIHSQLNYINKKNLGINPYYVINLTINQDVVKEKYILYKKAILTNSLIEKVSAVSYSPGNRGYRQSVWWEGMPENDFSNTINWIPVDEDFTKTLKIEIIRGDFFPDDISKTNSVFYVLNESALKKIAWSEPIGKQMDIIGRGKVIGIVKDFNYKSLYYNVEPLVLAYYPAAFDNLLVRVSSSNITGAINILKENWSLFFPNSTFEYSFLSDEIKEIYAKETVTSRMIDIVSLISVLISFIGLFGLVLLKVENYKKGICIRRSLGSTELDLLIKFNVDFIRPLLFSFLIACPVIFFLMRDWLLIFAFKIKLHWWFFSLSGLVTILISIVIVSFLTWKTIQTNFVEYLNREY